MDSDKGMPTNYESAATRDTREEHQKRRTSALAGEQLYEARKKEDEAHRIMEEEAFRQYEERIKEEYAKREGGA